MKRRSGYLLLESIISISIIVMIVSLAYYILIYSTEINTRIEDSIELQQQGNEISKYVKEIVQNSKGTIGAYEDGTCNNVKTIKCRYKEDVNALKDKEIFLNSDTNKVFIRTLGALGTNEGGGYEIGDYVDNMYISTDYGGKIVNIKLELSKNNTSLDKEFTINVINFEGENL